MTLLHDRLQCAQEIVQRVGKKLVVTTPLGLGKPVQLLNALYELAKSDPSIELTLLTGLSFLKPVIHGELANRLIGPFLNRVYGDYEDLLFEIDRRAENLPKNVRVLDFFFQAGAYNENEKAQRDFISCNYTHVVRDLLAYGVNVLAQMVACKPNDLTRFSLSCNSDLTNDLMLAKKDIFLVGQINKNLPYMYGKTVEVDANRFLLMLENEDCNRKLFSIPKQALTPQDFMIGIHVSSLIKDDGCLQIGIGALSDAVVYGMIVRHTENATYRQLLSELGISDRDSDPFHIGLFASTEMLVDGYLELYKHGILKKKVHESQGDSLVHAGFFVGSNAFYKQLNEMPKEERMLFSMRSISEVNQLYGDENKRREERKNASFVNTCMNATLLGAIASDGLPNGITISGVGGQYNFVVMAHELLGARSIMMCKSTRTKGNRVESNIVFSRENITIPRHLRDIVVTEYGIADLRGKTDEEVIKAMLNIADSRFQKRLLKEAKAIKKIAKNYEIPTRYSNNLPSSIAKTLKRYASIKDFFKDFPFGSEFEEREIVLQKLLRSLRAKSKLAQLYTLFRGLQVSPNHEQQKLLMRMALSKPSSLKDKIYRSLLLGLMREHSSRA